MNNAKPSILLVANWDSNVGYAWWLMESYWAAIAYEFSTTHRILLAYPSISKVPASIQKAPIETIENAFHDQSKTNLSEQLKLIKEYNVKYIYYTDKPARHSLYALYRLAGVKGIFVHDHTPGLRTAPTGVKKVIKALLSRLPLVNVDIAFGATDFIKKRLVEVSCLPEKKCIAINNGIPLGDTGTDSPFKAFNIDPDKKIIVTTGRLNPFKNIDFALKVLSELKSKHLNTDWHYLILGDGPAKEDLNTLVEELRLKDQVTFAGNVENPTRFYKECYISFHPSKGEVGFSLSMLENLYAGLPVLCSDNPSVSGIICDKTNGFIYEQNNISNAASILNSVLSENLVTPEMNLCCKNYVLENHDLERAKQMLVKKIKNNFNRQC